MRRVIGIVGEGPTDYMVLKEVVDHITGEENIYHRLQPEPNAMGQYGNGWKGVWKWCEDNAVLLDSIFDNIMPKLDLLIIQMDADVVRKEKEIHCVCELACRVRDSQVHPLSCERLKSENCPILLPCEAHENTPNGYRDHIENSIRTWLNSNGNREDVVITVPCDSTDAWIVAAYGDLENAEMVKDPWENVISRGKYYHDIRVPGNKKSTTVYAKFLPVLVREWENVVQLCENAKDFEEKIKEFLKDESCSII